jgi:hypothetical protein
VIKTVTLTAARRPILLGAAGLFFVVLLLILHRATLGSVDPDPVDFERLNVGQGRYLICPRDICPGHDE